MAIFQWESPNSGFECRSVSQSVSGTLDRPRVVAPSRTCGHVRSSRRRWGWAQCRPRSAAPTFSRVVLAGASTPAWCPVYRLRERPQPGVVRSGLESLPVVAARDQKWRVASDKSGLLSLWYTSLYQNATGVPNVPTVTNVTKMTKNDPSVPVFGSIHFYMGTWAFERTHY